MKKSFCKIPSARLQRLKLSLIKYNINLVHVPGKFLYIADFLSRYYDESDETPEIEDLQEFVHSINISSERLQLFRNEIETDKSLKELKNFLLEGWPNDKRKIPDDLIVYWKHRNDLTIENDIIFFNDRVIVPHSLRKDVLAQLHSSHLGIEKTKKRARSLVY